ncbi:MAG TPA: hypothetical protein PKD29_06690 [Rhodocyclaceae bacterium]|nr:hypothetical protein [Rhodocyclaceae bacterium]
MRKSANERRLTAQRLVALFLLGCALFNYPVLSLFNHPAQLLGIPLLYAYLFGAWVALIALIAWAVERGSD